MRENPWEFCPGFSPELLDLWFKCISSSIWYLSLQQPNLYRLFSSNPGGTEASSPPVPSAIKGRWCCRVQIRVSGRTHLWPCNSSLPILTCLTGEFAHFVIPCFAGWLCIDDKYYSHIITASVRQPLSLFPKEAVTDNKHQSNPTSNLIVFSKYH